MVGSFENYNEVFLGTVNANLMNGTSFIEVKTKNAGIQCSGGSQVMHIPASNHIAGAFLIPYCTGQKGIAELSCNDGREISATWTADSCTSGYGSGHDRQGGKFQFAFGMSEAEALARFEREGASASNRPTLPGYQPKETRAKVGFSTGTAFLVAVDGHLLTNWHVIEDATAISVVAHGVSRPVAVVAVDKANDVALLKSDVVGIPVPFRQSGRTSVAEEVMTLGYPLVSIQGNALKASFGRVNALSGVGDDKRYLQIDVPLQPGNSGGPLINDQGELVGIVTATLSQLAVLKRTGQLPQAVNYAVKAENIRPMLPPLSTSSSPPRISGFKAIADFYQNSVFLVVAK